MEIRKPIVLIGLMGAGKTVVGKHLAGKLGVRFSDSDEEIEHQAGISVAEIFERDGEEFFRKAESNFITRLLSENSPPFVLSTGGGAFINPATRAAIKENAISVWLKADIDTLIARVSRSHNRPLLADPENRREILEKLIEQRYPVYAEADFTVDSSINSAQAIAAKIMEEINGTVAS